jgi:hypothetical protein
VTDIQTLRRSRSEYLNAAADCTSFGLHLTVFMPINDGQTAAMSCFLCFLQPVLTLSAVPAHVGVEIAVSVTTRSQEGRLLDN